jgi:hypothetical protein
MDASMKNLQSAVASQELATKAILSQAKRSHSIVEALSQVLYEIQI